jgi:hypothetical protein
MPKRLNPQELRVTTFDPVAPPGAVSNNINPNSDYTECDCVLYTLNGMNTCGATYCNGGTCWFECSTAAC